MSRLLAIAESLPAEERRRARLLAGLLAAMWALIVAALVVVLATIPASDPRRARYVFLVTAVAAFLAVALWLGRSGHFSAAAAMMVLGAAVGPWGSVWLDPSIMRGDLIPLTYIVIPVLVSGMLLPVVFTASLAVAQVAGVAVLATRNQYDGPFNWPSLLGFVVSASLLSVLANVISRRDLRLLKSLSGLLPMCSSCKKVRDDSGSWQDVATYVHNHSEADFTHGICPECMEKLYPEFASGGESEWSAGHMTPPS